MAADSIIARAARALSTDPRVIASAITVYRARAGVTEDDLARWLGLSLARLHALALCTRPDPAGSGYAQRVAATARYVGCHSSRLLQVLDVAASAQEQPLRS